MGNFLKGDPKVITNKTSSLVSKYKLVVAACGTKLKRRECMKLYSSKDGEIVPVYYKKLERNTKGIGVVELYRTWYRTDSEEIKWCDQTGKWEFSEGVVEGLYAYKKHGTMLYKKFQTVRAIDRPKGKQFFILNEDLAGRTGYIPSKNRNVFYNESNFTSTDKKKESIKRTFALDINTTHSANKDNRLFRTITDLYGAYNPKIDFRTRQIARLLGKKTFGLEFETGSGALQDSALGNLGLVPLIDGSLSSRSQYEYTSVVWQGAKGLHSLKKSCERLSANCGVDHNCALHIHIGTIPDDKLFVVALHSLFYRLQDEIFGMVPHYKKDERGILGKNKDYSSPLPDLMISKNTLFEKGTTKKEYEEKLYNLYGILFNYYSCGKDMGQQYNPSNRKPKRRKGKIVKNASKVVPWRQQWNCLSRYHALNIVPLLFSPAGTVEFRVHGPTLNFDKTSAWLLICNAIVRYAETYPRKILEYKEKIRLSDVIFELSTNFGKDTTEKTVGLYSAISSHLDEYILDRTHFYAEQTVNSMAYAFNSGGESVNSTLGNLAREEFKGDSTFKFESSHMKHMW